MEDKMNKVNNESFISFNKYIFNVLIFKKEEYG